MNDPKKLNGWTGPMMVTLAERYTILQILLRHGKYNMSETNQEMAILFTHMVRGLDIECNAGSRKWSAILTPRL